MKAKPPSGIVVVLVVFLFVWCGVCVCFMDGVRVCVMVWCVCDFNSYLCSKQMEETQ